MKDTKEVVTVECSDFDFEMTAKALKRVNPTVWKDYSEKELTDYLINRAKAFAWANADRIKAGGGYYSTGGCVLNAMVTYNNNIRVIPSIMSYAVMAW